MEETKTATPARRAMRVSGRSVLPFLLLIIPSLRALSLFRPGSRLLNLQAGPWRRPLDPCVFITIPALPKTRPPAQSAGRAALHRRRLDAASTLSAVAGGFRAFLVVLFPRDPLDRGHPIALAEVD